MIIRPCLCYGFLKVPKRTRNSELDLEASLRRECQAIPLSQRLSTERFTFQNYSHLEVIQLFFICQLDKTVSLSVILFDILIRRKKYL
jgi:hypothetical protein